MIYGCEVLLGYDFLEDRNWLLKQEFRLLL